MTNARPKADSKAKKVMISFTLFGKPQFSEHSSPLPMNTSLPPRGLYAITPDEANSEHLFRAVAEILRGQPAMLQYRNKCADFSLRRYQARYILSLCRNAGVPLIINDFLKLAIEIEADGVHLGADDGEVVAARHTLGPGRILGVSCYNEWARAEAAAAIGADYVAFGSLFDSPTKPATVRAPLALLERAQRELGVAVAGIGGITLANVDQVFAAGADWAAVITDVFSAPDRQAQARTYRMMCNNHPFKLQRQ